MQGLKYNVQTILYELKEKEQNDMRSKIIELVYIKKKKSIQCFILNNNVKLITTSHKSLAIVKKPKPKGIKYRKCMAIVNSKYK
jgi:hypothetical protein